jgi:hypothetical protein
MVAAYGSCTVRISWAKAKAIRVLTRTPAIITPPSRNLDANRRSVRSWTSSSSGVPARRWRVAAKIVASGMVCDCTRSNERGWPAIQAAAWAKNPP